MPIWASDFLFHLPIKSTDIVSLAQVSKKCNTLIVFELIGEIDSESSVMI